MKEITIPGDECEKILYVCFNHDYWNYVMFQGREFDSSLSKRDNMNNQLKKYYKDFNFAMIERLPENRIIRYRPSVPTWANADRYIGRILNLKHEARFLGLSKLKD